MIRACPNASYLRRTNLGIIRHITAAAAVVAYRHARRALERLMISATRCRQKVPLLPFTSG